MTTGINDALYQKFIDAGAILHGHFILTSGKHSDTYVQCARVLEDPALTLELAVQTVGLLPADTVCDLVVSPAVGGILFGFAIAQTMGKRFVFAERESGTMTLRRAFHIEPGTKVVVAEDVVTTGGSVKEVCDLVEAEGGEVTAIVSLIDRGGDPAFSAPYYPLLSLEIASWDPADCELCKQGIEPFSLGSRTLK